ncbi:DUF6491 family protein [Dyella silvatica]|uniref:DUF6491 family protein n=1 Tax=Dyella silvatica TaxID=2992128 RepID=UPI00224CBE5C|nr:DUF6491 family protein [Dyella silvatica]
MTARRLILASSFTALFAACSSTPEVKQSDGDRIAMYAAAAGAPQRSFRFSDLYSWEPLSRTEVAIFTRPSEAYLLDLDGGCPNLAYANALGLTSSVNEVTAHFDRVMTGPGSYPCTITQIRPLDVAKLRLEQKAAQRKIEAKPRSPDQTPPKD